MKTKKTKEKKVCPAVREAKKELDRVNTCTKEGIALSFIYLPHYINVLKRIIKAK